MRAVGALIFGLVIVAVVAACGGFGGDDETAAPPARTTSAEVRNVVWERAYSECASYPVFRLAARYKVDANVPAVSAAVGRFWTDQFKGGDDAIQTGVEGCRQGLKNPTESARKQKPPSG